MARSTLLMVFITASYHHTLGFTIRGPVIRVHDAAWVPGKLRRTRQNLRVTPCERSAKLPQTRRGALNPGTRALSGSVLFSAAEEATDATAPAAVIPPQPTPTTTTPVTVAGGSKSLSRLASGTSFAAIVTADFILKRTFARVGCTFPSSLAGMGGLFAALVILEKALPEVAEKTVRLLEPGSAFLARWMPAFFVPSLVVLPLSPIPTSANALKLLLVVCGGWLLSLTSTAAVVTALSPSAPPGDTAGGPAKSPSKPAPLPVFRGKVVRGLGACAAVAGLLAVVGAGALSGDAAPSAVVGVLAKLSKPAAQLSLLLATLFGFSAGTRVPRRVSKAVHPVVTCAAVTMAAAAAIGKGVGLSFFDVLRSYVTRSRCPVHLGAGDLLLGLLGPSVLSFAVQMYRRVGVVKRKSLIFKNAKQVAGGSIFCASSGLFGTALASRLLDLPTTLRLATLSRNITSPLAMAICSMVGADFSLAIAIVVMTGVIGANFGATALDALGVKDPAARGLAQGGSAHGLGTAAMVNEPTAFAFSAVAMALTATASTVLVSIPAVRIALLRLALGAAAVAGGGAPVAMTV
ncbi:unnamed protein product [Scytosiphon promiscuus]